MYTDEPILEIIFCPVCKKYYIPCRDITETMCDCEKCCHCDDTELSKRKVNKILKMT